MDVTIRIADELCRQAQHKAVGAGLSLPGWIADVVSKELSDQPPKQPKTLLEALGNDGLSNVTVDFPRSETVARATDFS